MLEHMFVPMGLRAGEAVQVALVEDTPASVVTASARRFEVVRIDGCWRSWHVGGPDLECWRVLLEPASLVVLGNNLRTGGWTCLEVWD